MFVLGIDPGVSRCGFGVVAREGTRLVPAGFGVVRTPTTAPLEERLAQLDAELRQLVAGTKPDAIAVERVFFQSNARTAMSVGQASGLVLVIAVQSGIPVAQYTPSEVKMAVAGFGGADKAQMQQMVQALLRLPSPPQPADAADALALALCHHAAGPLRARQAEALARTERRSGDRARLAATTGRHP